MTYNNRYLVATYPTLHALLFLAIQNSSVSASMTLHLPVSSSYSTLAISRRIRAVDTLVAFDKAFISPSFHKKYFCRAQFHLRLLMWNLIGHKSAENKAINQYKFVYNTYKMERMKCYVSRRHPHFYFLNYWIVTVKI